LSGVSKPAGVWGRVSWGKGKGWNLCTLEKPLPLAGVKGIHKAKNSAYINLKKVFFYCFSVQNSHFGLLDSSNAMH